MWSLYKNEKKEMAVRRHLKHSGWHSLSNLNASVCLFVCVYKCMHHISMNLAADLNRMAIRICRVVERSAML